jgi:hypothetical protein
VFHSLIDYLKEKLMSICKLNVIAVALALSGAGFTAHARPGGEGGMSGAHMNAEGRENTNGPMAADRYKGQARAEDRMSEEGREHKKSNPNKKHMNPDSDMRR